VIRFKNIYHVFSYIFLITTSVSCGFIFTQENPEALTACDLLEEEEETLEAADHDSEFDDLFAAGSGTEDDPYLICTVEQLQNMNDPELLDHFFELGDNIDAGETGELYETDFGSEGFIPIGECSNSYCDGGGDVVFTGSFNGNGYTIFDLFIDSDKSGVGLF